MAGLVNWNLGFQQSPAGSDPGSVIDDKFQELKEQISRRGEQAGHIYTQDPNATAHGADVNNAKDGYHVVEADGTALGSPHIWKSPTTDSALDTKLVQYADDLITINEAGLTITGATSDLTLPNDLLVTGNISEPNIVGGNRPCAINAVTGEGGIPSGTQNTWEIILTGGLATSSADSNTPVRHFICMATWNGAWFTAVPATDRYSAKLEVEHDGTGGFIAPTIGGQLEHIDCDVFHSIAFPTGTPRGPAVSLMAYHAVASDAQTIQWQLSALKNDNTRELNLIDITMIAWELNR